MLCTTIIIIIVTHTRTLIKRGKTTTNLISVLFISINTDRQTHNNRTNEQQQKLKSKANCFFLSFEDFFSHSLYDFNFFPPHKNENVNVSFETKQQKFSAEKFLSFNNFPMCVYSKTKTKKVATIYHFLD